tara:strand:+ start:1449 stop:1652 length:204 start_codon:yes stop_codon:yes gene_type:complete
MKGIMSKQINKVSRKDVIEAIEFLFVEGYVHEMTSDKKYYVSKLLNKVANDYKIKLEWDAEMQDLLN